MSVTVVNVISAGDTKKCGKKRREKSEIKRQKEREREMRGGEREDSDEKTIE